MNKFFFNYFSFPFIKILFLDPIIEDIDQNNKNSDVSACQKQNDTIVNEEINTKENDNKESYLFFFFLEFNIDS